MIRFFGTLDFLKEDLEWKKGHADITYGKELLTLSNGNLQTEDLQLTFSGKNHTGSGQIDLALGIQLDRRYTPALRSGIQKNVESRLPANVKKYVSAELITDQVMKRLVSADGRVNLAFTISGTFDKPSPKLVHPQLPSLDDLVKSAVQDYAQKNKGQLIEKGKGLLQKLIKIK